MTDLHNFDRIRQLSADFYQQKLSRDEYLQLRKEVFDKIEQNLNVTPMESMDDLDNGLFNKLKSYFKKNESEEVV